MFGPKITTVFASRWKALWWSAGILMTAYCSVPREGEDSVADKAVSIALPYAKKTPAPDHHVNPWAKDTPATAA